MNFLKDEEKSIISCIDSPSYFLSKYISNIISNSLGKPGSYIEDSIDLKNKIKNIIIPDNYVLISLDVSSLFPKVPHDLVIKGI